MKLMRKAGDHVRQGDVLVERTTAEAITAAHVPAPRVNGRVELADGESSMHKHVVREPGVCLLVAEGISDRVMTVGEEMANLITEGGERGPGLMRHPGIAIPKGTYRVVIQREWTGEEVLDVAD